MEAIERLQSDSDRDVRYFAGRDEEVPYEGRRCSDDQMYMLRTTSRESLEDETIGRSPLEGDFAEEQIEAKLLGVETTDGGGEEVVAGVPLEVGSDEGFEDAEQSPGDEESEEHHEETGTESFVYHERPGEKSEEHDKGDESHVVDEETGQEETQLTQSEEELNKEDEVETSKQQEE